MQKPSDARKVIHKSRMSPEQLHALNCLNCIDNVNVLQSHLRHSIEAEREYLLKAMMMMLAKPSKRPLMEAVWRAYDRTGDMWKNECPHWMSKTWEILRGWCRAEWVVTSEVQEGEFDDESGVSMLLPPAKRVKMVEVKKEVMNVDDGDSDETASPPPRAGEADVLAETQRISKTQRDPNDTET